MSAAEVTTRRTRGVVLGLIALGVAVVGLAGFAIGAAVTDDDESQFRAQIEDSCREWMGSGSAAVGDADWCSEMAGWMANQVGGGHMPGGGMPSMMFGNAEFMLDMCRQWMTASPPAGADGVDAQGWCTRMSEWMGGRMGPGSGPMNGPMMGG